MRRLSLVLLAVLWCGAARADSLPDLFARGNAAYARGDHDAAVEEYETLLEARVADPAVTYNLALAHAALGHYGQAIRYLERTLLLAPGDDDAERVLKRVRDALGERQAKERGEAIVAERPALSSALFAGMHLHTLAWLLLVSVWALSCALLGLFWARAEAARLTLGISASLLAVLSAVAAFGLWAKHDFNAPGVRAIVLVDRTPLREGPDDRARMASELSEGESVRVLSRDGRFAHVQLARGSEGFVAASAVGEI